MQTYTTYFAQTYDSGAYGSQTYQTGSTSTTTGSTGGAASPGGGILTNTGFDILLAASIASAIVFGALVIRFWKRPNKLTN